MCNNVINFGPFFDGSRGSDSTGFGHLCIGWKSNQVADAGYMFADAFGSNGLVKVSSVSYEGTILDRGVLGVSNGDLMALDASEVLTEGLDWAQEGVVNALDCGVLANPISASSLFGNQNGEN